MIDFEGQVAIVTGGGRGIGRDTALALARRGARVLVNDHGGSRDTLTPGTIDVAQSVVDEITALGGEAVADGSAVGTGEAADTIVGRAVELYGRLDILVNNAGGGLGITEIDRGTDAEVEGVVRTNLLGPLMLIRRAWPIMTAQRYGRIVNLMSGTLVGMVGTAAYSAGKAGLIGVTNTAAIEGGPVGIFTNGVWPVALTRLAGDLKDPALYEYMKRFTTEHVAEAVVFLSSSHNSANGEMFTVGGGGVSRNAIYTNKGIVDVELTAERLAEQFAAARDLQTASPVEVRVVNNQDSTIYEQQSQQK